MLAIIWLEIITKSCEKISQNSLTLHTDSVDIIFQYILRHSSLYFFNKAEILEFWYFTLIFA